VDPGDHGYVGWWGGGGVKKRATVTSGGGEGRRGGGSGHAKWGLSGEKMNFGGLAGKEQTKEISKQTYRKILILWDVKETKELSFRN